MEGSVGPAGEVRAGQLNAAIANEIGKLTAEFTGRGSEKSRAFITGDVVVCLLENGATRGDGAVWELLGNLAGEKTVARTTTVDLQAQPEATTGLEQVWTACSACNSVV